MATNPLLSCRIKINRANKHFSDFEAAFKAFSHSNPYVIVLDEETEPAIKIYRVKFIQEIPPEFSAIIGDIAHNLMSALDSLAVSLVQFAKLVDLTEHVIAETYFPIHWDASGLSKQNTRISRFFERVGPEIEMLIRDLEPYRGGKGNDIFRLWRLNIVDKHRAIVPVASGLVGTTFTTPKSNGRPISDKPYQTSMIFPLKDGDEIGRRAFFEPEYYAAAHFLFGVSFGEGQIFERDAVIPTTQRLINLVTRLIDIFARNIFKSGW